MLIIDDLMHESGDSVSKIFTRDSYHKNISVVFITQNLFYGSKQNRTMSLNTHYLVLFKNPRDLTQIRNLASQMHPGKTKFLVDAYREATSQPFSYLLIELKPDTDEKLRIRANIFPGEPHYVYLPK